MWTSQQIRLHKAVLQNPLAGNSGETVICHHHSGSGPASAVSSVGAKPCRRHGGKSFPGEPPKIQPEDTHKD